MMRLMPSSPRRFPPPWTIEELNDACFVVIDKPKAHQEGAANEAPPPQLATAFRRLTRGVTVEVFFVR